MASPHDVHPHAAELKNPDGSWKYTNALEHETSPYLLQHAHNPVDWHPWGQKAFNLAREQGKPIFLSVGYSTCYWCHVMERQVFENPELAALLNEHFISIKVDREERPDVDDIYMMAVQLMTQHGGWPMSVFLTPPGAGGEDDKGLKPFWAGTYIPPKANYGRPGFGEVVLGLSDSWKNDRPKVIEVSQRVATVVSQRLSQRTEPGELTGQIVATAADQLFGNYDANNGGFGGAPKFPTPTNLLFLLGTYEVDPRPELWNAIAYTLERMARGGMYDQVGGGFHRYSTDEKWLVPHFEKMLYDNALLVETYLIAQAIRPHEKDPTFYTRVVRETCDYVLREMVDETGAFWSAQDAEVDAREGGNYLWQALEVSDALDDRDLTQQAMTLYGLDRGTNFRDPHDASAEPANVLFVPDAYPAVAKKLDLSLDDLVAARRTINERLLVVRDKRKQPSTDDKVLTAWNGLMIAGMARAGRDLDEPRYTAAAARAATYILKNMRDTDGGLLRTMRKGQAKIPAFLEDYAYFTHGLLELYRTDSKAYWLDSAKELVRMAEDRFADGQGGYFDTLADQADLFVRVRSTYDGATPTGNSVMSHNLVDLYQLTNDVVYLDRAVALLRSFSQDLQQMGAGMAHMQHGLLRAITAAPQRVAQAGGGEAPVPRPAVERPVTAEVDPAELDLSSGMARCRVVMTIGAGYHVNANKPGVRSVVPTAISLADAPGMTVQVGYPLGDHKKYEFADEPILVYEGKVEFDVIVNRNPTVKSQKAPRLVLRYQVCTENSCLRPTNINLPVTFK